MEINTRFADRTSGVVRNLVNNMRHQDVIHVLAVVPMTRLFGRLVNNVTPILSAQINDALWNIDG